MTRCRRCGFATGAALAVVVSSAVAGCVSRAGSDAELARLRSIRGQLATVDTTRAGARGRYAAYDVRLTSTSGLAATGRLLRPATGDGPWPAVLLNDGRELNSRALEYLPGDFGDVVVLSLDYPDALPYEVGAGELLVHGRRLRAEGERIPGLFSLGAAYLAERSDVDAERVGLAVTSFAVPFGVAAAALDRRFREIALVYGAGRFADVLSANLTLRPAFLRPPAAWLATRPLATLEPERFVARIAPRPIVMVNGEDDPQMPRAAVQSLYDAAREPKSLVWLRTGHLSPGDSALIRQLVDTAFARMIILRGSRGAPAPPPANPRAPSGRR